MKVCADFYAWPMATMSLTLGLGAIAFLPSPGIANETPPTPPPITSTVRPGDAACPIAPVSSEEQVMQIWSDRPFFLWRNYPRGTMESIEVEWRDEIFSGFERSLFRATVTGESYVSYVGTPLERGMQYYWLPYSSAMDPFIFVEGIPFEIMSEEAYAQVTQELEMAEQQWQEADLSPEEQIVERVAFFAERELWSDAMREAFTAPNPSDALLDYRELVFSSACSGE